MKKLYTARQVAQSKKIYWIKSYKAILSYMCRYEHILKPIKTRTVSGVRYYVEEENLNEFVRMFENSELL